MDTIYALATAQGKSGVAVVRLSGPSAHDAVRALAGNLPPARRASLRLLTDPDAGAIDSALVLVFDRGASFTGEDAAEFHIHGSRATIAATLRALSALPGLRLADPGEFTRRAFENGRMDLTQAEAVIDLIDAETADAAANAAGQIAGAMRNWLLSRGEPVTTTSSTSALS